MGDSLRTSIAQFNSTAGRVQGRAINVRAVEPASDLPGSGRGNLYVLVEVTGNDSGNAALYRQMLNAAQTAFYEASGGVSAGLLRAVRNAHSVLVHANRALPDANWRAGISCVALLGNELTIAQAGPALVMVSHPRTIDQYPAKPGPVGVSLGGEERPDAELYRTTVETGSMVLVAQSDWLATAPSESLAAITTTENPRLSVEYLAQLAGKADLSALLVGFASGLPSVADDGFAASDPVMVEAAAPVIASREASSQPARKPSPPPARVEHETRPTEAATAPWMSPPAARPVPSDLSQDHAGSASDEWRAELSERQTQAAIPREKPQKARPATPRQARTDDDATGKRSPWGLLLALVFIPLIVLALVLAMLWFRTRNAEAQFQQTLTGAETAITDADAQQDEVAARQRLNGARDFLEKARAIRPDDPQLVRLQTSYGTILARINHITPLYGLIPLWEFKETGRKPSRILLGGDSLFVLDQGKSEVVRFILSKLGDSATPADPAAVIKKSQPVGPAAVSELLDADWAPAAGNQRSRLLVLDLAGGLVAYDVQWGASRIAISGRERWGLPQLIKTYGGNLYVVDAKAGQILRYRPSANGYENTPEPYFTAATRVDLSGVQSIDIDGNVWILFADGRLLKFFAGEQKPFELQGLPDPLSAPTAVVAQNDGNLLYIADSGNGRILEFTKEGQFQRQFRPAEGNHLMGIRDLMLDEAGAKLYIITAEAIYKADLPKMPPAVRPAGTR